MLAVTCSYVHTMWCCYPSTQGSGLCLTCIYLLTALVPLVQIIQLFFQCTGMNLIFPYETLVTVAEFSLVLIVKGPWDPQFQGVGGSFCSLGVLCLCAKSLGTFSCVPRTHFAKKTAR